MRALIQRVSQASVSVTGTEIARIGTGFLILLGVGEDDNKETAHKLWRKIERLRIFPDAAGKSNLALADVGANVLIVSQFTLWADCSKGNRPSFVQAAAPALAEELYNYFIELASIDFPDLGKGIFAADMKVSLCNDGPFTIYLDTASM